MPPPCSRNLSTRTVLTTVLQCFAIILTLFRVWYRVSIRRFWWDDSWAAMASLCGTICLVSDWMHVTARTRDISVIGCWVYFFAFASVVWAVRMSILYSLARLIYPEKRSRRIVLSVAALFVILWGGIITERAYICGSSLRWYNSGKQTCCNLPASMDIYELATDVVSDIILVAWPLRILWNIKLPSNSQRRMILSIFSSTIVVSLVSLFRAVCRLMQFGSLVLTASELEVAFCLIVCNLLVVVTYFYRFYKRNRAHETSGDSDATTSDSDDYMYPMTTQYLTTVDLEHLGEYETTTSQSKTKSSCAEGHPLAAVPPGPADSNPMGPPPNT
ncbi:hypothetical protein BV22DRAFT_1012917 [Leucogyrophana mollusca]|uniref:Uncharacterized protein n=1 Tax=Leucogyrophana mollusca TaxID=85980 RepID=A0ACB8BJA8_9AGAM|nr:hypothetical protein BV22DRAFT_1012917 [Leucogyrophana mollusca]